MIIIPKAPPITVMITANLNAPLMVGQTGNTLTCIVFGVDRLNSTIAYQWMKNGGTTQTQVGNSRILTLPYLTLSSAGDYNCRVTVQSSLLNNNIMMNSSHRVMIQSELIIA